MINNMTQNEYENYLEELKNIKERKRHEDENNIKKKLIELYGNKFTINDKLNPNNLPSNEKEIFNKNYINDYLNTYTQITHDYISYLYGSSSLTESQYNYLIYISPPSSTKYIKTILYMQIEPDIFYNLPIYQKVN
jgi:hypothetical protein